MKSTSKRLVSIDLYRWIAACMVVFFHFGFRGFTTEEFQFIKYQSTVPYAKYGYLGVQFFFMISGFVIVYSISNRSWRDFLYARASRLFPVFWLCCFLTFILMYILDANHLAISFFDFLINLSMLPEKFDAPFVDGSYWSLAIEWNFYFLIVLMVCSLKSEQARYKSLLIIVYWGSIAAFAQLYSFSILFLIKQYISFFCIGISAYLLNKKWSLSSEVGFFLSLVVSLCVVYRQSFLLEDHYHVDFNQWIVLALVSIFAVMIRFFERISIPQFLSPMVVFLGGVSYPFYLLHQNIGYAVINKLGRYNMYWLALVIAVLGCFALSVVIYHFFDQPIQRFLKRYTIKGN